MGEDCIITINNSYYQCCHSDVYHITQYVLFYLTFVCRCCSIVIHTTAMYIYIIECNSTPCRDDAKKHGGPISRIRY